MFLFLLTSEGRMKDLSFSAELYLQKFKSEKDSPLSKFIKFYAMKQLQDEN